MERPKVNRLHRRRMARKRLRKAILEELSALVPDCLGSCRNSIKECLACLSGCPGKEKKPEG